MTKTDFMITSEDSRDHWPYVNVEGKVLLDLGCGRAVAHSDEYQQSPLFFGETLKASKVIGVDGNPEFNYSEVERLKNFVETEKINVDGKYTFIWKMILSPDDLRNLIKNYNITAIKCDIEGYETNFYTLTKEDLELVDVFALEYHQFDILETMTKKFEEWGFTIYAEGKFEYVHAPQAGVLLAKK
jgi:hypothetical protein